MARKRKPSTWLAVIVASATVLAAVVLLRVPTEPTPAPAPPAAPPLKVITYNVQFLPGPGRAFNKRGDPDYRAREIGRRLAEYDIIGFNEVFDEGPRDLLLATLREHMGQECHVLRPPPDARSPFGIDSGLALVSRLPILAAHHVSYGNDSSPLKYGLNADGFAAKGVLHARVGPRTDAPPAECFDVFVTHMESKDRQAREEQYGKLGEFVRLHAAPERPALILGDFNTRGNTAYRKDPTEAYHRLLTALRGARPGTEVIDVWPQLSDEEGGTNNQQSASGGWRIDYLFLSNPMSGPALRPRAVRVNRFLDPKVIALSDHSAVEAELDWTGRR